MGNSATIAVKDLNKGDRFDLGVYSLSEDEIISFATIFDPLIFHIDKEAARKSFFKGLVASGPHIFTLVHRKEWIPRFGHSVIAGVEVTNWKFLKPVYADMPVYSKASIMEIIPNPEKKITAIRWKYEFTSKEGELVQSLEMLVLHRMDS